MSIDALLCVGVVYLVQCGKDGWLVCVRQVGKEVLFMLQDPIADCLTRIRNGYMVRKEKVLVGHSAKNKNILNVLAEQGCIDSYEEVVNSVTNHPQISVALRYSQSSQGRRPAINKIRRFSRPGLRRFFSYKNIPTFKSGLAFGVMTTSKGVMTTHHAVLKKVGGELICVVE